MIVMIRCTLRQFLPLILKGVTITLELLHLTPYGLLLKTLWNRCQLNYLRIDYNYQERHIDE